ncbi:tyrosine-type recombinase/integrase [Methylobacterium nonmethylotrophicum]|uniref:Uncharacterized protein n=1 Tax=Methylobacterium nonmethylotrophicum TaxID=1141884 RepID=A0A4Z0NXU9_9HYPH|nr:tyrosine-type recombinase/integrase [Methylobacterium nonmethylotrophicum]TGE01427.1 hypothetical protein EU555_04805 [Methylobacterium nonmethylotrophicum]
MARYMAKPVIRGESPHRYEKRVPTDVVEKLKGREVWIELPAPAGGDPKLVHFRLGTLARVSVHTRDPALSHARCATIQAHLDQTYAAARSGPASLTPMRIEYLAGLVYDDIKRRFLENPGTPDGWAAVKAYTRAAVEGRVATAPRLARDFDPVDEVEIARELFGGTMTEAIDALPAGVHTSALDQRFGAYVDWVLGLKGLEIDQDSRAALLSRVGVAILNASWRMKRASQFDWSEDPAEARFPKIDPGDTKKRPTTAPTSVSFNELFDRWVRETDPRPSTRATWRGNIDRLIEFLEHDNIARVTKKDIIAWKDWLVARGLKSKTISASYLSCVKTLYNFAVANSLHTENPAKGVKISGSSRAGDSKLPYEDAEIAKLLDLAMRESVSYRRWVPWLIVLTGARVGEICQLWGSHIRTIDGINVISIEETEDGGTLKPSAERIVPIHPALIEAGFLDFAKGRGNKPLFYDRPSRGGDNRRHKSTHIYGRLGSWIRSNGFTDPRKSPSHATRHWFKSVASRVGIADSVADALQGHKDGKAASVYRHIGVKTLAEAIAKIPVPEQR